jgi:predicted dehydrogenase
LKLLVGHHRRFNTYIVTVKSILTSQKYSLGKPIAINGLWTLYKPPTYFASPTEWRSQSESGGPVLINLVHEVDLLHHLIGPIVRVYAERGLDSPRTAKSKDHDAESCVSITLRFANGVVGTFLLADNTPSPFNFEAGTGENPTIPRAGMDFYRIFCENGVVSVPDMRVWRHGPAKKSWTEELDVEMVDVPAMKKPFELQVAHFIRVIRGVEQPSCDGEDGLRALRVCDAVRRSTEAGHPVDIPL